MKKVLIFGFGEMGRKLADECLIYSDDVCVNAIVDNYVHESQYKEIPIIRPEKMKNYMYDEILICTVYFNEVIEDLFQNYGIPKEKMSFAEPVMPIIETRIRKKYEKELRSNEKIKGEKGKVIQYMKEHPARMYCYDFYDEYLNKKTNIYYDEAKGLYYGIYNNKPMYLARQFNTEQKARAYYNAVIMEQDTRSPHCYCNNEMLSSVTGVGVDIGAAEGIFSLSIVNQVKHIYIIETESSWIEALRYTFEPYKDRVTIIKSYISDKDTEETARLDTILQNQKIDFIKMDIEGAEFAALAGAEEIIKKNDIMLAVCVYHNENDNKKIKRWLDKRQLECRNSDGLVICQGDWELNNKDIDFRKALLFAMKNTVL